MSSSSYQRTQNSSQAKQKPKRAYRKLRQELKYELITRVKEQGLSIAQAARRLSINGSTAKVVVKKYKQARGTRFAAFQREEPSIEHLNQNVEEAPQTYYQPSFQPFYYFYNPNTYVLSQHMQSLYPMMLMIVPQMEKRE